MKIMSCNYYYISVLIFKKVIINRVVQGKTFKYVLKVDKNKIIVSYTFKQILIQYLIFHQYRLNEILSVPLISFI